jgi:hypothetical protein
MGRCRSGKPHPANAIRAIPRISRVPANTGLWRLPVAYGRTPACVAWQLCEALQLVRAYSGWMRRVWDSNPRGRVNALAVFKTAALGR